MSELHKSSEQNSDQADDIARIELSGMNGVDHGFGTSVEGVRTGGVFVKKGTADIGGSYVHEDAAFGALASEKTPHEIKSIQDSLGEAKRLTVDSLPNAQRPNDRRVGVNVGDQEVGGGAKFIGNKEFKLPNGRYINEADLMAAIANLSKANIPVTAESKTPVDATSERDGGNKLKRVIAALATAAALLSLLTASTSSHEDAPEQARAVASALDHAKEIPDILPPEVADPVEAPIPETPQNWYISEGMGGEDLFNQISVDPSKWYEIQDTLISQYPNYFYRSETGDVRFDHAGDVPTDIQQTIISLTQ